MTAQGGDRRMPALKIVPHPGARPSELRWRGRVAGTIQKLGTGGCRYLPGWQMAAFDPEPLMADFHRLPPALQRHHAPARTETVLVRRIEAEIAGGRA